jgi:hypothetical protein
LLRRSKGDPGYADDNKDSNAHQFSPRDEVAECLNPYNGGVSKLDHAVKAIRLRLALAEGRELPGAGKCGV